MTGRMSEEEASRVGAREKGIHNVKKKFKPAASSATLPPPVIEGDASALVHTCIKCKVASFSSRNALFKHVKTCGVVSESQTHHLDVDIVVRLNNYFGEEVMNRMVIAVVGGRLRGRTLQSAEQYSFKDNRWTLLPSMVDNRGSHGAAAVKDVVYAIAGGGMESNLCTCEKLRIQPGRIELELSEGKDEQEQIATVDSSSSSPSSSSQSWSYIAPMMTKRHALCVVSGGLNVDLPVIYAVGGWYDGSKCSAELESYDSLKDSWAMLSPMRVPRRLLGACLHGDGGQIFAFGGMVEDTNGWNTAAAEAYDIASDTWRDLKEVPVAGQASAVSVSMTGIGVGKGSDSAIAAVAAGGGDDVKIIVLCHGSHVFEYSIKDDSYTKISTLPINDWHCFECQSIGPFIFCFGGMSEGKYLDICRVFDVRDSSWSELPSMLRQRRRSAAAAMLLDIVI